MAPMPEQQHGLYMENYKVVTTEIQNRIKEHHKFWFFKIAAFASLISFTLTNGNVEVLLVVPFLMFIFDALTYNNINIMTACGMFILKGVEEVYRVEGWETMSSKTDYFGKSSLFWTSDFLLCLIFSISSLLISIYLYISMVSHVNIYLILVSGVGVVLDSLAHIYFIWQRRK